MESFSSQQVDEAERLESLLVAGNKGEDEDQMLQHNHHNRSCGCCRPNGRYTRLVARHPWILLSSVVIISIVLIVITLSFGHLPTFEKPGHAFQTVGTEFSGRREQFENVVKNTSRMPYDRYFLPVDSGKPGTSQRGLLTVKKRSNYDSFRSTVSTSSLLRKSRQVKKKRRKKRKRLKMCDRSLKILNMMSKLVITARTPQLDLLSLPSLQSQCLLQRWISKQKSVKHNCEMRRTTGTQSRIRCCPVWSLVNYFTVLAGKSSCQQSKIRQFNGRYIGRWPYLTPFNTLPILFLSLQLNKTDLPRVHLLLAKCIPFYRNKTLTSKCWMDGYVCFTVPPECQRNNNLFILFHYILPAASYEAHEIRTVSKSLFILPLNKGRSRKGFYQTLQSHKSRGNWSDTVLVEGMSFGLSDEILKDILLDDTRWLILSAGLIFGIIWLTTGSLLLTVITLVIISLSLVLGFFCYQLVFSINYFPFVNLMAIILALAVGADDVFIYSRIWHVSKRNVRDGTLEKLVSDSLRHACLSIFITSLTTSAALFANLVSNIVAIKCFVVYAGAVVLVNFLLMVTVIPACIVILDWNCHLKLSCQIVTSTVSRVSAGFNKVLLEWWPNIVIRLRYVSIALFLLLTTGSFVVIFHTPGFTFPNSTNQHFFEDSHPFAVYDKSQAKLFNFEVESEHDMKIQFWFVWGVSPLDTRSPFDPEKLSSRQALWDPAFNMTTHRAQRWLMTFCQNLEQTPFLDRSFLPYIECPFDRRMGSLDYFISSRNCSKENYACCNNLKDYPLSAKAFDSCIRAYAKASHGSGDTGFRFNNRGLVAFYVRLQSNVSQDAGYKELGNFHKTVESWFRREITSAPPELANGFFTSFAMMYDLHLNISEYLPLTLGLSVVISAVVMFLISLNFLITLYSVATILGILVTTVATLILAGWKIDIIESVIIILAIGLSIDFCIHMAVAYRLCHDQVRIQRARSALVKVGSPILAASLTTMLAGVGMLPSQLVIYRQMALFLIVVTVWAWFFASIILVAFLAVFGPQGDFGQLRWPRLVSCNCLCRSEPSRRLDKTVYSSDYDSTSGSTPHRSTELQELTVDATSALASVNHSQSPSIVPGSQACLQGEASHCGSHS